MKKAIKLTMGAVIATSALTPVAALAADVTKTAAKDGFYNITTGDFYTSAEFKALPKADQKALIKNVDVHLVFKGTVYKGMDIALLSSTELATAGVKEEAFEAANNNIDLTADGKVLDKDGKDLKDETTTTDFIVESVSAIESTIVEVTFPELTVALTDATVEVKDDKGVVREVVARDIAKGATKAQFDFKTAVKADELTGVWTVNGVSYSFVELKMVTDIVTESGKSPVNQVKVYNLLKDAGIKNVDADLIETYASDITGADATPILASDIQKIVDQTNKDAGKVANEATVVKAVADATNQIQLLPVLEANFDRVNPDWIADYATATVAAQGPMIDLDKANYLGVTGTGVTVADIQTTIDTANSTLNQSTGALNAGKIATLNTAADTTVKQAEVTSLIEKYIKADDPKAPTVTPKAKAIAASKAKEAAFRVAEATTENSLYNALVAYAGVTSDATLKVSELNSSLKTFYKDSFDTLTKDQLITDIKGNVSDIKGDIVTAADSDAVDIALDNVGITATAYAGAPTDATKKAAFSKALQTLANYTSHEALSANKFNLATIDNVVLDSYATALTAIDNTDAVSDVQTAVKTVNDNKALVAAVKVVGDANSTTMQVRDALVTLAVAESGNATATAFVNATSQQKLEAAQFIVDNNDLLADPITKSSIVTHGTPTAGDDAYNTTALSQALADHAAKVGEFNAIGNLATPQTTASTKGHLDTYAYAPYKALSAVQKLAVAEEINKLTKPTSATDATPVALNFAGTDAVKTLKAANDIIDAAITRVAEGKPLPSVTKVTKTVNTDLELADALTNHSVGTIVLAGNLNAPAVSITHLVNLDLGTHTLTGNLDFQVPSQSGTMKLSNGTLTGNLTVNTPLASFTNSATVSGSTTITNVAPGTFTNTGTLHAVTITDADGTRFVNNGTTGTVEVATAGAVTLEGSIANVIVTTANDSITNKGTITNFDAQAPVTLVNTGTVADVKGSSAVAVSGAGEVTKATNTNVTVTPAGVADQSLTKGDELAVSEGVHSTSFTWASTNGVGTNLVEKSGRYSYFNDGAYLDITVKEDNGSNVAFDTLFADMTLVTDDGNVDSIPGTAGRQLADWTGVDTGFFTKLKAASSKSVFYGVRQTGQTTAVGMTRTVGFKAGDSRKIDLALTPKEGIANGTYTVTIQPKQQTGVTTGTDLGTAIMYTFTVANTPQ